MPAFRAVDFGKATLISIVIAPIAVGAWIQGCGPSVQSVYEGNVRFEHCYRLDLDANIAAGHREACWRSYTERYHYGQTKDRIEYARRRIRALASGDTSRPQLDLEHTDAAAQQVSPAEAPLPTSVHAPPPPTARVASKDAGSDGGRGDGGGPPPEAACSAACWNVWKACGGTTCRADAGGKVGEACTACDRDYRRCMQRCFQ